MARPHPCRGHPGLRTLRFGGRIRKRPPAPLVPLMNVTCNVARKKPHTARLTAEFCLTKTVFKILFGINGQLKHWKDFT